MGVRMPEQMVATVSPSNNSYVETPFPKINLAFDVVIKGGRRFWRKKQQVRPRPLKLVIGSPIRTDDMRYEDRDALTERVMAQIRAMKAEWKQSGDKCDNLRVEPFWHCFLPTRPCDDRGWWGRVSRGRGS